MLEREGIGRHFVLADDKDVSGAHLVGGLERLFQAKRLVAKIDNQIVPAQFASHAGGFAIHPGAEGSNVDVGLANNRVRRRGRRSVKARAGPLRSQSQCPERRAAERFRQAVVSSAAENRHSAHRARHA